MAKVLYVDDEADIREIACLSLELDPSLEVRACASGAEGIAVATAWQPDLILLDVMMPGMDGPSTLSHLRDAPETASIPVVFITARVQPGESDNYIALGAVGVLAKPFDPMTLAEQVTAFLP
ncbi:response regulator [Croceicoccus pelagius]|uniref:Response regulator n=1 Tax=Croceicoccus pelagius TaxID=1703341 RepID=A0A917DND5_9SPHN|nr:response regulator [Croceicoccus pelagius]GGD54273.1 response regulator [Croceicoccus pelagius]